MNEISHRYIVSSFPTGQWRTDYRWLAIFYAVIKVGLADVQVSVHDNVAMENILNWPNHP
jgi:hypothetical protein